MRKLLLVICLIACACSSGKVSPTKSREPANEHSSIPGAYSSPKRVR